MEYEKEDSFNILMIPSSNGILGPSTEQYTKQQVKSSLCWLHKLMFQTSKWVYKDKLVYCDAQQCYRDVKYVYLGT